MQALERLERGQEELRGGQEELRGGQEELRGGQEELRGGLEELKGGQERLERTSGATVESLSRLSRAVRQLPGYQPPFELKTGEQPGWAGRPDRQTGSGAGPAVRLPTHDWDCAFSSTSCMRVELWGGLE
jgi:hypothetical protein